VIVIPDRETLETALIDMTFTGRVIVGMRESKERKQRKEAKKEQRKEQRKSKERSKERAKKGSKEREQRKGTFYFLQK